MTYLKEHIIIKIVAIVLVITLITPTLVKIAHVFEDHKHEVCLSTQQSHLHEFDVDCEFYKYKVSNAFTFNVNQINLLSFDNYHKTFRSQYQFISDYQRLAFTLRGPPQFV